MAQKPSDIEVPPLALRACSVEEHCRALIALRRLPFWWYQGVSRLFGNFSIPFHDACGNWWYQVKPGLAWPADCFRPIEADRARPAFSKAFLGYQHVAPDQASANSHLVINAIVDLPAYGSASIDAKRRNAVRKGLKSCALAVMDRPDEAALEGCRLAWNELTSRTGWKHAADPASFSESWRLLVDCPGVSIIVGREAATGQVAGFLVTKIIGDTAYVDTIASHTAMLHTNVNDAVMYAFLLNAVKLAGVTKAHYAIRSSVTNLEKFKTGLGFVPHPFPARTVLRPGVGLALRVLFRAKYDRMTGRFDDDAAQSPEA